MRVIACTQKDISPYGYEMHPCVWVVHVQVRREEFPQEAASVVEQISRTSWLSKMNEIDHASYESRMQNTLQDIKDAIQAGGNGGDEKMVRVFMEYLISVNAQNALKTQSHKVVPLAELWKEKSSGNPGFDFHTINPQQFLIFGEAKYKKKNSPFKNAFLQIANFVKGDKHIRELTDLARVAAKRSAKRVLKGDFGIAAAFSVKPGRVEDTIDKAIRHETFKSLLTNKEIYMVAIEIV